MEGIGQILERGIEGGLYQAATFRAFDAEETLIDLSAGACSVASIFDVASVTKIFTALVFSRLRTEGALSEKTRLGDLECIVAPPDKEDITLLSLVSHTSGLPGYAPLYERFVPEGGGIMLQRKEEAGEKVIDAILAMPRARTPPEMIVYSDPGYILLGHIIEHLAGLSLDRLVDKHLAGPLRLQDTSFTPLGRYHHCETGRLVSSGFCPLRKREIVGEVEDLNCFVLGGVSGHAGLFSAGYDLERLGRELFLSREGRSKVIDAAGLSFLLGEITDQAGNRRRVGFDVPAPRNSAAGRYFSEESAGHLGFTGVSLWLDFARSRGMVFLANRVYFGGDREKFNAVRREVHDRAWELLGI